MLRTFVCAAVALAFFASVGLSADKAAKIKTFKGMVKKIDPVTGTITMTVKVKKQDTDMDFKVPDTAKVVVFTGDDKKELSTKDGLKSDQLKEGAVIAVITDADKNVTEVQLGDLPKKKKKSQ